MLEQTKKALRNELTDLTDLRRRRQGIEAEECRVLALLGTPVKKIRTKAEPAPASKPAPKTKPKVKKAPGIREAFEAGAVVPPGTTLKDAILAVSEKHPEGSTIDEILSTVKASHPKTTRGSVQMRVLELHKAGRLARSGKGVYKPAKAGK